MFKYGFDINELLNIVGFILSQGLVILILSVVLLKKKIIKKKFFINKK